MYSRAVLVATGVGCPFQWAKSLLGDHQPHLALPIIGTLPFPEKQQFRTKFPTNGVVPAQIMSGFAIDDTHVISRGMNELVAWSPQDGNWAAMIGSS